ncbi:transglycosylase SLT domain-containing protein [Nonomuraea diastatica]|uniref:Lytic transglycosylase n=1 Tax=Nonomuraea diastatica TaxID=1848329 RepID=A0A4R4X5U8_9ACTN|nr:transglycosylase SLT domain-containing protein [Nonomuraea diastatica]TDD25738.1 lytic transglycosylase [Nonomuraea diastatica]
MSAFDEVRAAPGGGELADLAARVAGAPEAITAAANVWRTAAGTGGQHTGALRTAVSDVDQAWQGAGADAFAGYMGKLTGCGDRFQQALQDCASHLDAAASTLSAAERQALEICQAYASAAQELRGRTPGLTEGQVTQSMQPALGEARSALRKLVADTGRALTDTAAKLQSALGTIPDVAKELPEPDAQPFAPTPGRRLGWSPAEAESRATALAASAPSSSSGGSGGFGGYGSSGPPPPGGGPAPQGQVAGWINQAIAILRVHGYSLDKMNPNDIWMIIKHESGGNPHAINNWDSNAAKGTPSKGLMQTIDPTFESHKLPGHGNIYDPVDNIIAGVRYAIDRYGSVSNVPGVIGMKTGGGYRGY